MKSMMALENTTILQSVFDNYNSSFWNDTDIETSQYAYEERVFVAVTIFIISIGIVGNAIVLIAVALSRRLQTVTNVFVANLSIADLIMSIWGSINASIVLIRGGLPPSLDTLCQAIAFTNPSMAGVILFSIAAIAVNRMLLITKCSTVYRNIYTARKLVLKVVIIWLVPFMVTGILLATDVGRLSYNNRVHLCLDDSEHKYSVLYKTLLAAILYPGPVMITIVCYGIIYVFIRRHFKKEQIARCNIPKQSSSCTPTTNSQSQDTSTVDLGVNRAIDCSRKKRIHKHQIQITKNLFIVSCLCFLLPLPNVIFIILGLDRLFLYGVIFLFANSAVNPLLYGAKHPMFREVMLCILHRQWSDIPEPSRILKALHSKGSRI